MGRNVWYNDQVIVDAEEIAPAFEFSKFAQTAVREKIDRQKILNEKLRGEGDTDE